MLRTQHYVHTTFPWVLTTPTIRQGRFQGQWYIRNSMKGNLYGNLVFRTYYFVLFALLFTHQCVQSASCQLPLQQWAVLYWQTPCFALTSSVIVQGGITLAFRIYFRGACFKTGRVSGEGFFSSVQEIAVTL